MQKLLINSVGERDYSAQETCHLLLQLPMLRASRDFIMLRLDGSRAVGDRLDEDQPATALSALDHYIGRPTTPQFNEMTLLHYVQQFTMPKQLGSNPSRRRKAFVVIVPPYFSPDPSGLKYKEYCRQLIRPHQPHHTSRAAPAAPHQPLSMRLRIHRIRAHARPQNAVHSPSICMKIALFDLLVWGSLRLAPKTVQ